VFLACHLVFPVLVEGHADPNGHNGQVEIIFSPRPFLGAAGCGGLGSRGDFCFPGRDVRNQDALKKVNDSDDELVAVLARDHLASLHSISYPRRAHPEASRQIRKWCSELPHRPKAKKALCQNSLLAATSGKHLLPIDFVNLGNPVCNALKIIAASSQLRIELLKGVRVRGGG
jgi:hypothetical protein